MLSPEEFLTNYVTVIGHVDILFYDCGGFNIREEPKFLHTKFLHKKEKEASRRERSNTPVSNYKPAAEESLEEDAPILKVLESCKGLTVLRCDSLESLVENETAATEIARPRSRSSENVEEKQELGVCGL